MTRSGDAGRRPPEGGALHPGTARHLVRPRHPAAAAATRIPGRCAVVVSALCAAAPALARAQDTAIVIQPESAEALVAPQALPRLVAEEAIRRYNAPTTTRLVGRTRLPRGNEWRGDVAVRDGALWLGGRVQGTVLVINGFATLDSTATITGDLLVVGGAVERAPGATVSGEVRVYPGPLGYRIDGDQIALAPVNLRRWLPRFSVEKSWGSADSRSSLTLATGGTFNRVEGLPIVAGPVFDWKLRQDMRLRLDALGVFRTAGDVTETKSSLGYLVRAELRSGEVPSYRLEVRAYDVVAPIEDWGLHPAEVGWEAFLFQHDYRDYYGNQGIGGRATFQPERALSLAFEVRRESQTTLAARDPWTVFSSSRGWRPNPPIDDGHYTTFTGLVTFDTRNDQSEPTSGWYLRARLEHARSSDVSPQTGVPPAVRPAIPTDGSYQYSRLFFDFRRYTRVSPSGRLNLRLLGAGWMGGDALPLQARVSMGGPEPLAGYGFRHTACNRDIIDPAFAGTLVAACDRALLAQVEYRGHLSLHWSYNASRPEDEQSRSLFTLQGPDLVVLGDAGQGWLIGSGPGRLPSDRLPTLGSWLADLGLGIDWSGLGVYVAKAVTAGEPLRFTLRLNHRF